MKANKLKAIFAVTSLAAAMSVASYAATNPAGGTGIISPTEDVKNDIDNGPIPGFGGNVTNPATGSGTSDIQQGNNQQAGSNNTSGNAGGTTAPPLPVENTSVEDSVGTCDLQTTQKEAIEVAFEIIAAAPKVDDLFNNSSAAAQGCFAASSQVINLAMQIPDFSPSWSNLGNIIKQNINSMIAAKQQELLAIGCAIADQALLAAISPIQDYMQQYTGVLGGLTGNFEVTGISGGGFGGGMNGGSYNPFEGVMGVTGNTISQAKERAAADGVAANTKANDLRSQYDDMVNNMPQPNTNTSGPSTGNSGPSTGNSGTPKDNTGAPRPQIGAAPPQPSEPPSPVVAPIWPESMSANGSSGKNPF